MFPRYSQVKSYRGSRVQLPNPFAPTAATYHWVEEKDDPTVVSVFALRPGAHKSAVGMTHHLPSYCLREISSKIPSLTAVPEKALLSAVFPYRPCVCRIMSDYITVDSNTHGAGFWILADMVDIIVIARDEQ